MDTPICPACGCSLVRLGISKNEAPVCLGEKPVESTVELEHDGTTLHFCRCPHCTEAFERNPEHYLTRLAG